MSQSCSLQQEHVYKLISSSASLKLLAHSASSAAEGIPGVIFVAAFALLLVETVHATEVRSVGVIAARILVGLWKRLKGPTAFIA